MTTTLLLDVSEWDLVLDVFGNIAVASEPYSLAQDAASAIKTFQGEVYYDQTLGIPYWSEILAQRPSISLMKSQFVAAAMTVPGVTAAVCFITSIIGRQVNGQIQITTATGQTAVAAF